MQNFSDFRVERKETVLKEEEKTYRFVYLWYDDPEDPDDPEATADDFIKEGEKLGLKAFKVDVQGAYSDLENGVRYIYDGMAEKERKFKIDENTIVFVRAPVTKRKAWSDFLTQLERAGVVCVNTRACMEITSDKYRTSLYLAEAELNQPKTVLIHHSEKAIDAMKRLGGKYPVILKTLTGSLGIGVIKVDSESSLHSTVQLMYKLDPNMGVLLQTMIDDFTFDIRAHVIGGKFHGAIKRPQVEKDFRTNVSLGSKPEPIELTDLEIEHVEKAAKAVDGLWVGVDIFPSKDRNKIPPMFIEINSTPGTKGYRKATGENLPKKVLEKFKNRDYWLKPTTYISMFEDKVQADDMVFEGDLVKWSRNGIDYVHEVIDISNSNNPVIELNSQKVELIR
jgi:gamma-F420-2:alpha-L-glutamate ligase